MTRKSEPQNKAQTADTKDAQVEPKKGETLCDICSEPVEATMLTEHRVKEHDR